MTIDELILALTADSVAVFFFFLVLPILAFLIALVSKQRSNKPPFSYIFSFLIYLVAIAGVLSLTFWIYAIFNGQGSLTDLPFTIYYLPSISMLMTFFLISKHANIRKLPWFGELYELVTIIAVVFGLLLLFMHLGLFPLLQLWQLILIFVIVFIVLKLAWERLLRIIS